MNELLNIIGSILQGISVEAGLQIFIIYFGVTWILLIIWIIKDIGIRTHSVLFQLFCVLVVLVGTPFALPIYLVLRPRRTLYDKYYDAVEENLDILYEIISEREAEKDKEEVEEKLKKGEKVIKRLDFNEQKEIGQEDDKKKTKKEEKESSEEKLEEEIEIKKNKKADKEERKIIARIKLEK